MRLNQLTKVQRYYGRVRLGRAELSQCSKTLQLASQVLFSHRPPILDVEFQLTLLANRYAMLSQVVRGTELPTFIDKTFHVKTLEAHSLEAIKLSAVVKGSLAHPR